MHAENKKAEIFSTLKNKNFYKMETSIGSVVMVKDLNDHTKTN